jgi:hypothetical protein
MARSGCGRAEAEIRSVRLGKPRRQWHATGRAEEAAGSSSRLGAVGRVVSSGQAARIRKAGCETGGGGVFSWLDLNWKRRDGRRWIKRADPPWEQSAKSEMEMDRRSKQTYSNATMMIRRRRCLSSTDVWMLSSASCFSCPEKVHFRRPMYRHPPLSARIWPVSRPCSKYLPDQDQINVNSNIASTCCSTRPSSPCRARPKPGRNCTAL